jgi:NTE family protein
VLVRLDRPAFRHLLASNAQVSIALTRQIIHRLQSAQSRSNPVTIALLPITQGIQLPELAQRLAEQLQRIGRVRIVDAASIDRDLQPSGLARSEVDDADAKRRLTLHLDEIEADNDFVLLVGDEGPTAWTQRCCRFSDEVLLLAEAAQPPVLHDTERQCLMQRSGRAEAAETLVLLHPADLPCPAGTREWLSRRPVGRHIHLRPALERDMARLARILSGAAVGLVLAGGGARGCAHLGIYRALQERGIDIDFVGGTSIGSVMATLVASDRPLDEVMRIARPAFSVNPTGDFNFLPLLSLIKGRRLRHLIETALQDLLGRNADVEDLWKNCFFIASNYSQATEHVARRGNLVKSILASIAIPGALPPVLHEGDLLCDGGTFNNFPANVMRATRGVGQVIGVDLSLQKRRPIDHDEVPGSWVLLRDRLRPRHKRRYKLPSLMSYLMNVTILYSASRQRESQKLTDLYFNPPLERVGMLQWEKFDAIVEQGYAHGNDVLSTLGEDGLKPFAPLPAAPTTAAPGQRA